MKHKKWGAIGSLIVLFMIGGIGMFIFNQNKAQRKEQDMISMETTTAKQIKNTFADIKEIYFSENYGENKLTGYTEVMVKVLTSYGASAEIGVSMSPNGKVDQFYVGSGAPSLKKRITETVVRVTLSNKDEEDF